LQQLGRQRDARELVADRGDRAIAERQPVGDRLARHRVAQGDRALEAQPRADLDAGAAAEVEIDLAAVGLHDAPDDDDVGDGR
jgi:hypothetical protein